MINNDMIIMQYLEGNNKAMQYHANIIMTIHAHISQKGCSLTLCNRPMPAAACNHVQLDFPVC